MLTDDELRALMADVESDRSERTTSTNNTDKFGEAICAFANDFPNHRQAGYLLVGVDDAGSTSGLTVTDGLLRNLAALRSNINLEPLPAMTVQRHSMPGGDVAVIEVLPSDLPPVRYKGRIWIRVGPSRRGANQQEERVLIEKRTVHLLFAKDPLRWIPGAYVHFVRWDGTTMAAEPVSDKRFEGDLLTVLREMQAFLPLPAQSHPVAESAFRERTEADYPPVALRELLLNAVMHRSYESNAPVRFNWFDDRIEVQNPGGLYGMASPENFPRQTDYRNPVVAGAMATLGFVNAFGRGVIRAQDALRRNGNPPAEFTFEPSHVLATIRRKR